MKSPIITGLLLALSLSCFAISKKKLHEKMDSWLGHSKHELVMNWGIPDKTGDDGDGGEIVAYVHSGYRSSAYGQSRSWYDYRIFYINSGGNIYSWKTMRKNIPPQQIDLNIYRY